MRGVRVAIVTGASRGLGAGLAADLAARGIRLGLCARHEPGLPEGADPAGVVTAAVDVTDAAAVDRFVTGVADRLGPVDLCVANAGVLEPVKPLRLADPDLVARNVAVNLVGVAHTAAAYARHVRARPGGGTLVGISSGAARTPYAGWAAYCASKAGVEQLLAVVAEEEAEAGLDVLAVAPGVVDTDMQAQIRATPAEDFPSVARFHRLKAEDAFNSAGWVARCLLGWVEDPASRPVTHGALRVPDEPRG